MRFNQQLLKRLQSESFSSRQLLLHQVDIWVQLIPSPGFTIKFTPLGDQSSYLEDEGTILAKNADTYELYLLETDKKLY